MKNIFILAAIAALSLVGVSSSAGATDLIGFNGATVGSNGLGTLTTYDGYTWNNFGVVAPALYLPSGFSNDTMSGYTQLAFGGNTLNADSTITSSTAGTTFTFNGGSFVSAWEDNQWIEISGEDSQGKVITNGLGLLDQTEVEVTTTGKSTLNGLNWTGVSQLVFETVTNNPSNFLLQTLNTLSGASLVSTYGNGDTFGADYLCINTACPSGDGGNGGGSTVPLPGSLPLLGGALAMLAGFVVYRRRTV
jgi:hypothetical protein